MRPFALCVLGACFLAVPGSVWAATRTNTFTGQCTSVPVSVTYSTPLHEYLQDVSYSAVLDGGSCSGTVNGRSFQNVPLKGRALFHGLDSCNAGSTSGRAHLVVDGKNIYASLLYRRVGRDLTVIFQGDSGGRLISKAHARVGLISNSDPLAQNPVLAPFADQQGTADVTAECLGPGLSKASVVVEQANAVPSISSPAYEKHWESR